MGKTFIQTNFFSPYLYLVSTLDRLRFHPLSTLSSVQVLLSLLVQQLRSMPWIVRSVVLSIRSSAWYTRLIANNCAKVGFFQYRVDCQTRSLSSFPNVTFLIAGQRFTLTPFQYLLILSGVTNNPVCYTVFVPLNMSDSNGNLYWILGDYFLYRFYSVFDMTRNQLGLAMSIFYKWTQKIDRIPLNNTITTEVPTPAMNITRGASSASTVNNTMKTTSTRASSTAIKQTTTCFNDILFGRLLILSIVFISLNYH